MKFTKKLVGLLLAATIKLSYYCDKFDPKKNYAGIILYHHQGKYKWKQTKGTVAGGFNCQFLYVYIRCTDEWTGQDFQEAGGGRVHDKMFKDMFRVGFQNRRSCCGGFAIMKGKRKYSSWWLNDQTSSKTKIKWESDGSKELSEGERKLVDVAIDKWIKEGGDTIVYVPTSTHLELLNAR